MVARVQNNGLANIVAAIRAYASIPKYLQWGTGTGAIASANVVTTTTTTEARTTGTDSTVTTTVTSDTFQVAGTITAAGARSITEVGLFDAAGAASPPTGGNMCVYADFGVITLATGDAIAFTVKVQYT